MAGEQAILVEIDKLQRERRHRDERALFFVEGIRNLVRAVEHGHRIDAVVASEILLTSSVAKKLVRNLARERVAIARVSPEDFRAISRAERASGVGAILHQPIVALHSVKPRAGTCWVVLSRVRSPGNFGSLIRTSAAVGGAGFILVGGAVDPFDPAVVRASMGSIFGQTLVRTGSTQLRHWVRRHRLQVVGASPDADLAYDELAYRRPPLFVLGEERRGLDSEQRNLCDALVRIPMLPGTDSLNLAIAGSLLMYESFRAPRRTR